MRRLVYYCVPEEYMEKPDFFQEWNKKKWTEFRVVDSEEIYEKRGLKAKFLTTFTDTAEELAQFLWVLKRENEMLEIQTRMQEPDEKRSKSVIEKENNLAMVLDEMSIKKIQYVAFYMADGQIQKLASTNGDESLHVWARKGMEGSFAKILNKWAELGDFFHYELGE